jgi:hypothetical protein
VNNAFPCYDEPAVEAADFCASDLRLAGRGPQHRIRRRSHGAGAPLRRRWSVVVVGGGGGGGTGTAAGIVSGRRVDGAWQQRCVAAFPTDIPAGIPTDSGVAGVDRAAAVAAPRAPPVQWHPKAPGRALVKSVTVHTLEPTHVNGKVTAV